MTDTCYHMFHIVQALEVLLVFIVLDCDTRLHPVEALMALMAKLTTCTHVLQHFKHVD